MIYEDVWVVIWVENGENRINGIYDNEKDAQDEADFYNNSYGAKNGKAGERIKSFNLSNGTCQVETNLFYVEKSQLARTKE